VQADTPSVTTLVDALAGHGAAPAFARPAYRLSGLDGGLAQPGGGARNSHRIG
jgi:hypothetical protein